MMESGGKSLFKRHYPGLDLMRTIAITLVMVRHFGERVVSMPEESFVAHFVYWSAHGITLFFALSGFLIGGQIIEETLEGRFSFKRFYMKRFWRIFPPYYFSLAVLTFIYLAGLNTKVIGVLSHPPERFFGEIFVHLIYIQNYVETTLQDSIYWSLAVEEQFYILIPGLIYICISMFGRGLSWLLLVLIMGAVAIRYMVYLGGAGTGFDFDALIWRPFHTRFDSLLVGVFTALVFIRYKEKICANGRIVSAAAVGISVAALAVSFIFGGLSDWYFDVCWDFTITGIGFSALVLWASMVSFDRWYFPRRALGVIAKLSYPMYLYHLLLILPVARFVAGFFEGGGFAAFCLAFVVYFAAVVAFSGVTYILIDRTSMGYRKRLLERWGA